MAEPKPRGGSNRSRAKTSAIGGRRFEVCCAGTWWIWLVWPRPLGPCWLWRVNGCSPGRKPVNVWCMGADCMTRSLAKAEAAGALIDKPGGGPLRRDVPGVLTGTPNKVLSCGRSALALLAPPSCVLPGFCPFCLASMICLCWSRTSKLRCSCSLMLGSFVWKPGDRQAKPTSCMARPADSRDVRGADGRAVCGPRLAVLEERSRRLGRGREDCMGGEPGSLLMLITGGTPMRLQSGVSRLLCTSKGPDLLCWGAFPACVSLCDSCCRDFCTRSRRPITPGAPRG